MGKGHIYIKVQLLVIPFVTKYMYA